MDEWVKLSEHFASEASSYLPAKNNLMALSDICRFLSTSDLGRELAPTAESGSGRIVLIKRNGSFPTKSLRVMSLAEEKIEFCLRDTGIERYFHPDEPYRYALDRFKEVARSIDWRKPVTPPTFFENLSVARKALFSKRYNR